MERSPEEVARPSALADKVAVVLGGTAGIGRAVALALARAGADVVATGRRVEHVDRVAGEIEREGRRTLRATADVTDRDTLERLRASTLSAFGRVDVLVNCAGKIRRSPTLDVTDADWADVLDTNLTGTLRGCQVFGRHMVERGYGRIVNVASLNSFVALHEVAAYGASKAGVMALTRSLAIEWAPQGVCVNAIAPGIVRTDLNAQLLDGTARGKELLQRTPMGRFGRVEEVAGAAVFLASDAASFVNGQVIVIDGGFLASGVNQ
ncbi:MAG TPA: glucose 1-dehydrogenase [Polyangiaceae bacterium]|nr:glucose 1-dehydrogenase [Polyangiaceae bacterium]